VQNEDEHSHSETDSALVARCRAGDCSAFRRLVERHEHYAYAIAFRLVCSEQRARDVVQESFIRVWKNLDRFDPDRKFTTWLYSIVAHQACDEMRSNRRRMGLFTSLREEGEREAGSGDLAEEVSNRDLAESIRRLTGELPPTQRIVFILRDLQDMSVDEVSETLGLSHSSVKANLSYARTRIRKRLNDLTA